MHCIWCKDHCSVLAADRLQAERAVNVTVISHLWLFYLRYKHSSSLDHVEK